MVQKQMSMSVWRMCLFQVYTYLTRIYKYNEIDLVDSKKAHEMANQVLWWQCYSPVYSFFTGLKFHYHSVKPYYASFYSEHQQRLRLIPRKGVPLVVFCSYLLSCAVDKTQKWLPTYLYNVSFRFILCEGSIKWTFFSEENNMYTNNFNFCFEQFKSIVKNTVSTGENKNAFHWVKIEYVSFFLFLFHLMIAA